MIEQYYGQDIIESFGTIFAIILIGGGILFMALWEPDPIAPAIAADSPTIIETPVVNTTPASLVWDNETIEELMLRSNGYHMGDWHHWFKGDVEGIKPGVYTLDLSSWATVYGYKILPRYHSHSVSWGTGAYFLVTPAPGNEFLFVLVNMYLDDGEAKQYTMPLSSWAVDINGLMYYPYEPDETQIDIKELHEVWDLAHVDNVVPYPYKIVQRKGTGVITAEYQDWLYGGRSQAHDGWLLFEVPIGTRPEDVKVVGTFNNLGGSAWWNLV